MASDDLAFAQEISSNDNIIAVCGFFFSLKWKYRTWIFIKKAIT